LVVTVPKGLLDYLEWEEGDHVLLEAKRIARGDTTFYETVEPKVLIVEKLKSEEEE